MSNSYTQVSYIVSGRNSLFVSNTPRPITTTHCHLLELKIQKLLSALCLTNGIYALGDEVRRFIAPQESSLSKGDVGNPKQKN